MEDLQLQHALEEGSQAGRPRLQEAVRLEGDALPHLHPESLPVAAHERHQGTQECLRHAVAKSLVVRAQAALQRGHLPRRKGGQSASARQSPFQEPGGQVKKSRSCPLTHARSLKK